MFTLGIRILGRCSTKIICLNCFGGEKRKGDESCVSIERIDAYLRIKIAVQVPFELKTHSFNVWAKDIKRMARRLLDKDVSTIG